MNLENNENTNQSSGMSMQTSGTCDSQSQKQKDPWCSLLPLSEMCLMIISGISINQNKKYLVVTNFTIFCENTTAVFNT